MASVSIIDSQLPHFSRTITPDSSNISAASSSGYSGCHTGIRSFRKYYAGTNNSQIFCLQNQICAQHINKSNAIHSPATLCQHSPSVKKKFQSIVRLNECKHFHYDSVELGPVIVSLISDLSDFDLQTITDEELISLKWKFIVESNDKKILISRSFYELAEFDRQLHRCVFDRRHSRLRELSSFLNCNCLTPETSSCTASSSSVNNSAVETLQLHCHSTLKSFFPCINLTGIRDEIVIYVNRLSQLTGSIIKCYPVLKFLELDSHGNHFIPIEQSQINRPAIAVAIVVSNYSATEPNHLDLKVGDIISVIEMNEDKSNKYNGTSNEKDFLYLGKLTVPKLQSSKYLEQPKNGKSKQRSGLARASSVIFNFTNNKFNKNDFFQLHQNMDKTKRPDDEILDKHFKVGYFPKCCVRIFTDKCVDSHILNSNKESGEKLKYKNTISKDNESLRKRVKLAAIAAAPRFARWQSERRPIIKSLLNIFIDSSSLSKNLSLKVFGVDLQEHLLNSGKSVPLVLTLCINVIENYGIVTGIYRQCGIQSNIRKLRWEFDSGLEPNLLERGILCDIHCVSSLLKQYFRQLPNPLFTYELYEDLIAAYDSENVTSRRIASVQAVVRRLPLTHFRTAMCLLKHLSKISKFKKITDMTASNLAIVWAPNLIKSPTQGISDAHLLIGLDLHKSLCNFLILNANAIFGSQTTLSASYDIHKVSTANDYSVFENDVAIDKFVAHKLQHFTNSNNAPTNLVIHSPSLMASTTTIDANNNKTGNTTDNESIKQLRQCIEINGGLANLPSDFHTVIDRPNNLVSLKETLNDKNVDSFTSWRKFVNNTSIEHSLSVFWNTKSNTFRRKKNKKTMANGKSSVLRSRSVEIGTQFKNHQKEKGEDGLTRSFVNWRSDSLFFHFGKNVSNFRNNVIRRMCSAKEHSSGVEEDGSSDETFQQTFDHPHTHARYSESSSPQNSKENNTPAHASLDRRPKINNKYQDQDKSNLDSSLLRPQLVKQSLTSPLLTHRPLPPQPLSSMPNSHNGRKTNFQIPVQNRHLNENANTINLNKLQKRSPLLHSSNFDIVEKNKKLSLGIINNHSNFFNDFPQKYINTNVIHSQYVHSKASPLAQLKHYRQLENVTASTQHFPRIYANSEKRLGHTIPDMSSTESLPLDVSRYDNVATSHNTKKHSKPKNKSRTYRPISTPVIISKTLSPPPSPTTDKSHGLPLMHSSYAIVGASGIIPLNNTQYNQYYF